MNKDMMAYIGGIVRIVTSLLGGYLVQKGLATNAETEGITGAVVLAGTGLWSIYAKWKALKAIPPGAVPIYGAVPVLLLFLLPSLLLTGCATTWTRTPILSESTNGETVTADAVTLKVGIGTKEATSMGAYQLSAEGGLSIKNLDTQTDSSLALLQAFQLGAQFAGAYAGKNIVPVTLSDQSAADVVSPPTAPVAKAGLTKTKKTAAASEAQVVYSTDGYGGSPGASGEGVYGRPSCARCRAYHTAHPDAQIINLDDAANRTSLWAALRRLGFTGSIAGLPVAVTADAYTLGTK